MTGYDWEGVQLLDTPGVHAGYADRDTTTYQTIDKADLLVFVITGELFDDLASTRDKAAEIPARDQQNGDGPQYAGDQAT